MSIEYKSSFERYNNEEKQKIYNLLKKGDIIYYEEIINFNFDSNIGRLICNFIPELFMEQTFKYYFISNTHTFGYPSDCIFLQASRIPIALFFEDYLIDLIIEKDLGDKINTGYSKLNCGLFYKFKSENKEIYYTYDIFTPFIIEKNNIKIIKKKEFLKKAYFAKTFSTDDENIESKGIFLSSSTDLNDTLISNIYKEFSNEFELEELINGFENNKIIIDNIKVEEKIFSEFFGYCENDNNKDNYKFSIKFKNYIYTSKKKYEDLLFYIIDKTVLNIKEKLENKIFLKNIMSKDEKKRIENKFDVSIEDNLDFIEIDYKLDSLLFSIINTYNNGPGGKYYFLIDKNFEYSYEDLINTLMEYCSRLKNIISKYFKDNNFYINDNK